MTHESCGREDNVTLSHKVGQNIRHLRLQQGRTQRDLAGDSMSPGFISQVERGQTSPSLASLERIADQLEVSISKLFPSENTVDRVWEKTQILLTLTRVHLMLGETKDALAHLERAENIWSDESSTAEDQTMVATFCLCRGLIELQAGRLNEALTYLTDASETFDKSQITGTRPLECLLGLGEVHLLRQNYLLAIRFFDSVVEQLENQHNITQPQRYLMMAEWGLGRSYLNMGELETSRQFLQRSQARASGLSDFKNLLGTITDSCHEHLQRSELLTAHAESHQAYALSFHQFVRRRKAQMLWRMGEVNEHLGNRHDSVEFLEEAENLATQIGEVKIAAEALLFKGRINLRQGELSKAASAADDVLSTVDPDTEPLVYGKASLLAGKANANRDAIDLAKKHLKTAENCFRRAKELSLLAQTQRELGQIYMVEEKHNEALRYFHRSSELFSQLSNEMNNSFPLDDPSRRN